MVVLPLVLERPFCLHGHFGSPIHVELAAEVGGWSDPGDDHSVGLVSAAEAGVLGSPDFPAAVAVFAFSHHLEDDVHLCLVFVGIVGRTVDREIRGFPGGLGYSSRSVVHIRWAAEDRPLVYSLVAKVVVGEGSLGHNAHARNRWLHRGHRSIGRFVDLHRIRSLHILHVAAVGAHSPGREIDRSCHIAVEEDSQHSVGAPGPAGADRSSPGEERGIG
jgi:hypothetical protein